MPAVMIEKVAIVKALRTAFPATFSGLYDQAEMGIDLTEDMEPLTGVVDAPAPSKSDRQRLDSRPVVVSAETVEDIIESTQAMIADADEEIVHDDDEGIIVLDEGDITVEDDIIATPPNCEKDGHAGGIYEVHQSPSTGVRRWAHSFSYELNGQSKTSWCLYEGSVAVPDA